jgi:hypothetical protein
MIGAHLRFFLVLYRLPNNGYFLFGRILLLPGTDLRIKLHEDGMWEILKSRVYLVKISGILERKWGVGTVFT